MALQWQRSFIPVGKGIDQSTDERVRAADVLTKCTNGYYNRSGAISKRRGFTKMAVVDQNNTTLDSGARAIFSAGDELCMLHKHKLYAYHTKWARWIERGYVSPACGEQRTVWHSDKTHTVVDVSIDESTGYCLYAAAREHSQDGTGATESDLFCEVAWFVRHKADQNVMPPLFEPVGGTATAANKHHAPRCLSASGRLYGLYMKGVSNPCQLRLVRWSTSSPATTDPVDVAAVSTDLKNFGKNTRTYDAVALSSGEFAVAYITDTDDDIQLEVWDPTTTTVDRSATITGTFERVAICEDTTNDQLLIFVLASGEPQDLNLYGYDIDALTNNFGPVLIREVPDNIPYPGPDGATIVWYADNLGVATGDVGGNEVFCCTWDESESSNYDTYVNACARMGRSVDGTALSNAEVTYNATNRTRPWLHDERYYVARETRVSPHIWSSPVVQLDVGETVPDVDPTYEHVWGHGNKGWVWEAGFVSGFDYVNGQDTPAILAAIYDVGTGGADAARQLGNGANVIEHDTGVFRWMGTGMQYGFQLGTNSGIKTDGNEFTFDTTQIPSTVVVHRGSVVVGGGFVGWYDGYTVTELGHAVAPIPDYAEHYTDGSGAHNDADISAQFMWLSYDANGVLHRSMPSFAASTHPGGAGSGTPADEAVDWRLRTNPATLRHDNVHTGAIMFRDDGTSAGVFKRVTEPKRYEPNINTSNVMEGLEDYGQDLAESIYTTGGAEIEAVCPEGARFVAVAAGRLWLGDSWRRDRVSYSKPIAPGSAAEQAIAPEFNEGFTYLLDSGQSVTAMASLDDKLIVFTASRIYMITGDGPDNGGRNNTFSGLTLINGDSGCIDARSIASTPEGIFYQSDAGIMLLGRGLDVRYVGGPVEDELNDYPYVSSAVVVPDQTQVRFTVEDQDPDARQGCVLVFDYTMGVWCKWEVYSAASTLVAPVSACLHDGTYYIMDEDSQVWRYSTTTYADNSTVYVPMTVETGWLQLAEQAGWKRVRRVDVMARKQNSHQLKVELFTDFNSTATTSHTFTNAAITAMPDESNVLLAAITPVVQKCSAIKVRVSCLDEGSTPNSAGYSLAGFTLEYGIKRGKMRTAYTQRN